MNVKQRNMSDFTDARGNKQPIQIAMNYDQARHKNMQAYPSNNMVFCASVLLILVGLGFAVTLIILPAFLPAQTSLTGSFFFAAISIYLIYILTRRANNISNSSSIISEQQKLIECLKKQVSDLQKEHREIRQRYREEKLRADTSSKSKTAFLAHLSHDIRTPLNHIIGFADMIGHQTFGPLGDRRYLSYINDIKQSGEGLLLSIAGVLELAELESGQRILVREAIVIDEFLGALKTRFVSRASRCGIALKITGNCNVELFGDAVGLTRIMENLLDNAIRFTPSGGEIRLTSWLANDGVVLEVTDTGIGISQERQTQIFSPFSLEEATRSKEHGGMGLGLAIAQAITELSGGEIAIDSSPAIGTTVAVSLPLNVQKNPSSSAVA